MSSAKSKTLLIKMLTVHLKIFLESTLNQRREYMRLERGHGKSQVVEDTEYFRPREDFRQDLQGEIQNNTWTRRVPWNHLQNNRGDLSLQMNKHHTSSSGILSPSQSYTESWQLKSEKLFSIPFLGLPLHCFVPKATRASASL